MKKSFSFLLVIFLLVSSIISVSHAEQSIKVKLDGKPVSLDVPPYIEKGRTLVPMRAIFEALGAAVEWDSVSKSVTGVKGDRKIVLKVDDISAVVDGETTQLDVPARIKNGRTFVPTRFIAESLNVRVYWDSIANSVVLLSDAVDISDDSQYLSKGNISSSTKGEVSFWHFNRDEMPLMIQEFKKYYPNIRVNATVIPDKDSQYKNNVIAAAMAGEGLPDIMTAEASMKSKFFSTSDCFCDLTESVGDITGNMYPYTVDFGKDNEGKIRGLSYNITAGAIGYKRAVAKKYLGTDDPAKVSQMLSSRDQILKTAKTLKEKSGGKVSMFPSWSELFNIYSGARSSGWVIDNRLTIDSKILDLMDLTKTMRDKGYESGYDAWSMGWSVAIADDATAMCWSIPTWGVPYIIGSNDRKARDGGRWRLAKPTFPYFWGGTWMGVSETSENKDIAIGLVRFFVSNKSHLKNWASTTGDIPNNKSIIKEFSADNSKIDPTTGQNLYKIFGDTAQTANGKLATEYDDFINNYFYDVMRSYLAGKIKTRDNAISQFKLKVLTNLPDLVID